jgi:hypothetical protein
MGIDVLHYPDLIRVERELFAYDPRFDTGKFGQGDEQSRKVGDGHLYDGVRDYEPGDDARFIDWKKTAMRSDNGISLRQYYEEKAPLTVLVSDIPTDQKYRETPGVISARTLGLIVARQLTEVCATQGSPVLAAWTYGYENTRKPKVFEGHRIASKKIAELGLDSSRQSSDLVIRAREASKKRGIFGKKPETLELPTAEPFSKTLEKAMKQSVQLAGMARFIVMSDFRLGDDTEETFDLMKKLNNRSDVLAIQITNPLLREIPSDVERLSDGMGGSILIETQAQRDKYKELQEARQQYINSKLKSTSAKAVIVDTSDPITVKSVKALTI